MDYFVGLTDYGWFSYLRERHPDDVNFWKPSGQPFSAVPPGAPFLFKLKAPINKIAGVGFFSTYKPLPLRVAWDAFTERNGCGTFREFQAKIERYRVRNGNTPSQGPMVVGCTILTDPVFFSDEEMLDQPEDWSGPIVTGKRYSTASTIGAKIWEQVQQRLAVRSFYNRESFKTEERAFLNDDERYRETLSKVRLGQGAFRIMVTSAYEDACAFTGDHTLPVLEAAHIKPFALSGPHLVSNGLLLRSDLHKLFDTGYLTVTPDYHIEVSPLIREEFHNGKEYYAMHGKVLKVIPKNPVEKPDMELLRWHNENIFMAG
jgi:putative restriction endonuclease